MTFQGFLIMFCPEIQCQYEIAIKKYNQALNKDPGNAVVLNMLAKVQMLAGETKNAKKHFIHAIKQ